MKISDFSFNDLLVFPWVFFAKGPSIRSHHKIKNIYIRREYMPLFLISLAVFTAIEYIMQYAKHFVVVIVEYLHICDGLVL